MRGSSAAYVLVSLVRVAAQDASCPCITSWATGPYLNSEGGLNVQLYSSMYSYPIDYGLSSCAAHDINLPPYCSADNPPSWCLDSWCYVDASNCAKAYSDAVYFEGLHYSYFTCGSANSFDSWYGVNATGAHPLTDLVGLMHGYVQSISNTLEDSVAEVSTSSACLPPSSCPCTDCAPPSPAWLATPPATTPPMTLGTAAYHQRPGTPVSATDTCLARILTSSFTRIASKESDPNRIGFEYYGSQDLGNYIQWPGMEDCSSYDPRYRPWYAAAAAGPKDVVMVMDTSGSMAGNRESMARQAAKLVVETLTDVDYVNIVRFSSGASSYSPILVQATEANKASLVNWITNNIDASGSTNFRDAFSKTWQVIDATTTSSGCNKVVLFMSDGEPTDWDESDGQSVMVKANSYSPPVHVLTYALGSGADKSVLRSISCKANGVFYATDDNGDLASTMAGYYKVLAPMLKPCVTRWVSYDDTYTGERLLGACLASFEKLSVSDATSCNGGLNGLGDTGDGRVPTLIGVSCVDINLVVPLDVLEAHPEWSEFSAQVEAEMSSCSRVSVTEAQMETLRQQAGSDAVCSIDSAADVCTSSMSVEECAAAVEAATGVPIGVIVGVVVGVIVAVVCGIGYCCYCNRSKNKAPSYPAPRSEQPPRPVQQVAAPQVVQPVVVQQPVVVMAQPVAQQPVAYAQAVPMGSVPMGTAA